jgi:hypothetical protein
VTGFNPNDPNTDQGTDMQVAASYRRKTGALDAHGNRHKVIAYLALATGNSDQLALAMYLFGAAGIGIKFPNTAMDQFNAGKPWDVTKNAKIEGGHYIPGVGRDAKGNVVVVMTPRFYTKYCDEVVVYVSEEALTTSGKTLEGFNLAREIRPGRCRCMRQARPWRRRSGFNM